MLPLRFLRTDNLGLQLRELLFSGLNQILNRGRLLVDSTVFVVLSDMNIQGGEVGLQLGVVVADSLQRGLEVSSVDAHLLILDVLVFSVVRHDFTDGVVDGVAHMVVSGGG